MMVDSLKKSVLLLALAGLFFSGNSFAQEIKLILTGQTHAMLYPCDCPIEPDGGIARRASLIQQIKKENPNILLLDSGSFFAGGVMDPDSQGEELDKVRTLVNLKAMEMMKYDAVTLGSDEFNFGGQFLQENITKTKISFLGANISSEKIALYMIKKFGKVQAGVIGLVNPLGAKNQKFQFISAQEVLKKVVGQLKKQNIDIIILMSGLDEAQNQALLKDNPEINIIIEGAKFAKEKVFTNAGEVLVLSPRWEGRRLIAVSLSVNNKKIEVKKVEDLRVDDKLANDKQILSILPQCFFDKNCKKEGMISTCVNPGKSNAQCQYKQADRVDLTVINKPDCVTCDTKAVVNSLKKDFPGLVVSKLDYPGEKAEKIIKELGLKYLPVYLAGKNIEKDPAFGKLKPNFELKGGYYFLNAQTAGIGYFLGRQKFVDRLDVFLSLFNKDSGELLDTLKEFTPEVHFLVREEKDGFSAPGGKIEVEECLRAVCVRKYSPGLFYNYITCRAKNSETSWWDVCLQNVDGSAVKICAQGNEGKVLLKENIDLNRQLEIANGPVYLIGNEEIFSSVKVPKKEEFRKILKR